jgi:hypothetical protein
LLFIGDVINCADIQIPYPGVGTVYDSNLSLAAEVRKKIFNMLL